MENEGIAQSFLTLAVVDEWSASCPARFTPAKFPVPTEQEAEWVPEPVWTLSCLESNAGRPAQSPPLYRVILPTPGHTLPITEISY
jgi:hypothetical protein